MGRAFARKSPAFTNPMHSAISAAHSLHCRRFGLGGSSNCGSNSIMISVEECWFPLFSWWEDAEVFVLLPVSFTRAFYKGFAGARTDRMLPVDSPVGQDFNEWGHPCRTGRNTATRATCAAPGCRRGGVGVLDQFEGFLVGQFSDRLSLDARSGTIASALANHGFGLQSGISTV
jgi:hypothetical protein